MTQLLLMRHAKSSWTDPTLADFDRPLNKRGRRDAPRMGALLNERCITIDVIVTSAARRARDTAQEVLTALANSPTCIEDENLYHADSTALSRALLELPNRPAGVLMIGHNPGLEYWLYELTGQAESLPTATIAHVRFDVPIWELAAYQLQGRLIDVWRPKEVLPDA